MPAPAEPTSSIDLAGLESRIRDGCSNAICPGPIETPLLTEWLLADPEAKRVRLARNPSGRFGKPEDIVNAGIFLASDESAWTNGAVLVLDGGITSNYF